jgi:hypothetical protein
VDDAIIYDKSNNDEDDIGDNDDKADEKMVTTKLVRVARMMTVVKIVEMTMIPSMVLMMWLQTTAADVSAQLVRKILCLQRAAQAFRHQDRARKIPQNNQL